jgi:hypothetical protein
LITKSKSASSGEEAIVHSSSSTVYPNPSANYFTLQVRSAKEGPVEVRVTDMQGRRVFTKQGVRAAVNFGHDFVSGTYIVEIIQNGKRQILKIVKQ